MMHSCQVRTSAVVSDLLLLCRATHAKAGLNVLRKPTGQRTPSGSSTLEVIISDDEVSDDDDDDDQSLTAKTSPRSSTSDALLEAAALATDSGSRDSPIGLSMPQKPGKPADSSDISLTACSAAAGSLAAARRSSPGSQGSAESALTAVRTPTKIPRAPQCGLATPPTRTTPDGRFGEPARARTPGSEFSSMASR